MVTKNHARNTKFSSFDVTKDVECICFSVKMIYNNCVRYKTIFLWGVFSEQVLSIEEMDNPKDEIMQGRVGN